MYEVQYIKVSHVKRNYFSQLKKTYWLQAGALTGNTHNIFVSDNIKTVDESNSARRAF